MHRDLKPQNILFRDNGRPVIVDFGLAKSVGAQRHLTRHGEVMATPRYMSPEQCHGQAGRPRSDLYSLGVIFYEMLDRSQALRGARARPGWSTSTCTARYPRCCRRASPGYQTILDRLLAKNPEERFQSARELFAMIAI